MKNLNFISNDRNSNHFAYAKDKYLFNIKKERFLDFSMNSGVYFFGYNDVDVVSTLSTEIMSGLSFPGSSVNNSLLTDRLGDFLPTIFDSLVFCNSGTEATQRAIRYARIFSKKSIVVSFSGGWHGMNEWTIFDDGSRLGLNNTSNDLFGIPDSMNNSRLCLEYDINEISKLDSFSSKIACIIVEPVQGSNPQPSAKLFLNCLKNYCLKNNIILIFDEIITGFRLSKGGASEYFDVMPDIATYGKVLGGGLPIGLVALSKTLTSQYHELPYLPTGGTFSANSLVSGVSLSVLNKLFTFDYTNFNQKSSEIIVLMNNIFSNLNVAVRVVGVGSIFRLVFTKDVFLNRTQRDNLELNSKFNHKALKNSLLFYNINWPLNGIFFNSTVHEIEDFSYLANSISQIFINHSN
jgi:glutamate-1-semialdehyde 2,1-aminomutase